MAKHYTNKNEFNNLIAALVKIYGQDCVKLAIDNLILPPWADLGLFGSVHLYAVYTAEAPDGHEYDEVDYQTVVRILDGVVFQEKKKPVGKKKRKATPDSYAWTREKVEKLIANGQTKPIGIGSPEGILNMSALLNTIKSEKDKMVLAKTFAHFHSGMLLAHTAAENRVFIRVTQELYDAGLKLSADEWCKPDENGMSEASVLEVGDVIIVTTHEDGSVTGYRVEEAIFEQTYSY